MKKPKPKNPVLKRLTAIATKMEPGLIILRSNDPDQLLRQLDKITEAEAAELLDKGYQFVVFGEDIEIMNIDDKHLREMGLQRVNRFASKQRH